MGNRAIIRVRHDRNPLAEPVQLYVHWFDQFQFNRILDKAIRSGVRSDCLASAIVAEYVAEDRKANHKVFSRSSGPSFTTVRIESTTVVHADLDVPPIIIAASKDETVVTYANDPEHPEIFPACRP